MTVESVRVRSRQFHVRYGIRIRDFTLNLNGKKFVSDSESNGEKPLWKNLGFLFYFKQNRVVERGGKPIFSAQGIPQI